MPDWDQFGRNLIYGAIHRPAQLAEWIGSLFQGQAASLGAAIIAGAQELDNEAAYQLRPYVPPLPVLTLPPPPPGGGGGTGGGGVSGPGPGPGPGGMPPPPYYYQPWTYQPEPSLPYWRQVLGWYEQWFPLPLTMTISWYYNGFNTATVTGVPPPGAQTGAGWGPGYWQAELAPPV